MYEIIEKKENLNSGEIEHTRVTKQTKRVKQDEFIHIYLEDLGGLFNLKGDGEYKVMAYLWKHSKFFKKGDIANSVIINPRLIAELVDITGLKATSIRNIISKLSKKELLISTEFRGCYFLNPLYFFKGDNKYRKGSYETVIKYIVEVPNVESPNINFDEETGEIYE